MRQCGMSADPGGTGKSKSAGAVCGGTDAEHEDRNGADGADAVCIGYFREVTKMKEMNLDN